MICRYDDSGNNTPSLIQNTSYTGIRQKQVRKQLHSLSAKCATYLRVAASVVLASDTQVRGFKPDRSRRIFKGR